ncbi:MAG: hypothetical protein GY828_05770 [Candidatus Gracilibacteria bacterium]|nr:hypothetical protein [Candidatus Gracilibacteria bacterium]
MKMNKKVKLYIVLIIFLLTFLGGVIYNNLPSDTNLVKDVFIKNKDWDSPMKSDIPYVVGNDIELYYILDNPDTTSAEISLNELRQYIDIQKVQIGETELGLQDSFSLDIDKNTPIKITGIAKTNNNIDEHNFKELIDVKFSEITETTPVEIIPDPIDENILQETLTSTNYSLNQLSFHSNINNILIIEGNIPLEFDTVKIGEILFTPTFKDNKAYIMIPKASFVSGQYAVNIYLSHTEIIELDDKISFQYVSSELNIVNITPNLVQNSKKRDIVIQGNGFQKIISLQLNNNIILKNTSFHIINDKVMSVTIPKGLDPGEYSFNIMTTNDIIPMKSSTFSITE